MVQEGIIVNHAISNKGIEVDKAKVEVIEKLRPPASAKGVRSFIGHVGFYQRFIKDFSKITNFSPNCLSRICILGLMKNALVVFPG